MLSFKVKYFFQYHFFCYLVKDTVLCTLNIGDSIVIISSDGVLYMLYPSGLRKIRSFPFKFDNEYQKSMGFEEYTMSSFEGSCSVHKEDIFTLVNGKCRKTHNFIDFEVSHLNHASPYVTTTIFNNELISIAGYDQEIDPAVIGMVETFRNDSWITGDIPRVLESGWVLQLGNVLSLRNKNQSVRRMITNLFHLKNLAINKNQ